MIEPMNRIQTSLCTLLGIILIGALVGCQEQHAYITSPVYIISDPLWIAYYGADKVDPEDIRVVDEESSSVFRERSEEVTLEDTRPVLLSPLLSIAIEDIWFDAIARHVYYFIAEESEPKIASEFAVPITISRKEGVRQAGRALAQHAIDEPLSKKIPILYHSDLDAFLVDSLIAGVQEITLGREIETVYVDQEVDPLDDLFDQYASEDYTKGAGIFLGERSIEGIEIWSSFGLDYAYVSSFTGALRGGQSLGSIDMDIITLFETLQQRIRSQDWSPVVLETALQ